VARVGAPVEHVLMIASGQLELYRKNREADTQMLVGVIESPAILGDAELYGRSQWVVMVRAAVSSVVVRMPGVAFDRMVASDGRIAAGLYRDSCARHLLAVEIMQVLTLQKTQNKILRLLLALARRDADERPVARVSQVQLADALGLNAKTVRRHLAELERSGKIERRREEIVLSGEQAEWGHLGRGFGAAWRLAKRR
jgi:CRP-like cAMP-binding protein